jgi:radical SAM superfamily enzyme YgiQ (UPF0313 family)
MHVVLWDTRRQDVSKDFAGGFGVGQFTGRGVRGRIIRHFYRRDRRPVALIFANLAAIFGRLGHTVQYVEDRTDRAADLYVFCPSLMGLQLERAAMARILSENPQARILVTGQVATVLPRAFDGLNVTVVKGEAEQLLWKLDEVLQHPGATVQLGTIEDLDRLPPPDWSPFEPGRFRVAYDFSRFPTALVQQSRGCTMQCGYCPYIIQENTVRFRDPAAVAEEIHRGTESWGFRSYKFRDPLFGLNRAHVFQLAELLGRLPRPIQFSVETRIDVMRHELLRVLRRVGLTSVTVGVETPDQEKLRRHGRLPVDADQQRRFFATCRGMGIRTVAGFMIGFPDDTESSIQAVLDHARLLGATFANFNIFTPYPGTRYAEENRNRFAEPRFDRYTAYTPVIGTEHFTRRQLESLHARCFRQYYFRWRYLWENAAVLWPVLERLGLGRRQELPSGQGAHDAPPRPMSGLELLRRRKDLRQDGPHAHPGTADKRSGPKPTE